MTPRFEWTAVLAIAFAALLLRLWGSGFGLPFTYHPDEHQYVDTAVAMLGGELNPGRFNNPSLLKYSLAAIDGVWWTAGRAVGQFASRDDFRAAFAADPTAAYRLARGFVALIGALTAVAAWRLGRSVYGPEVGLAAGALLAGAFLHVRESHFAVSDVPVTLLCTLALLFAVRVLRHARPRDYAACGLLVGLAAAAKYSGVVVAVPVVVAHLLAEESRPRQWPGRLLDLRLVGAGLLAVAAFLAAVPFAVLDWTAFREDVLLLLQRGREGFKGLALTPYPGWLFYLDALRWGVGLPMLVLMVAGIAMAVLRRRRVEIVLVSFPIVLYVYLARQLLIFERFVLPALPVLAVLAAAVLHVAVRRAVASPRRQGPVFAAIVLLVVLPSTISAIRFDWLLTQSDTRTLAKAWIETNVPEGSKVLAHGNGPELAGNGHTAPLSRRSFALTEVGTTELEDEPPEHYEAEGFSYVVTSSFSTDRRLLDEAEDARRQAYFADLAQRWEVVAAFRPHGSAEPPFRFAQLYSPATDLWHLDRPGPTVTVYRLPRQ